MEVDRVSRRNWLGWISFEGRKPRLSGDNVANGRSLFGGLFGSCLGGCLRLWHDVFVVQCWLRVNGVQTVEDERATSVRLFHQKRVSAFGIHDFHALDI